MDQLVLIKDLAEGKVASVKEKKIKAYNEVLSFWTKQKKQTPQKKNLKKGLDSSHK